ncbi:bifunctional proline dehydrogenase/L-glutamate gamma-semialdehyde dehydrogenase [Lentisalinibacter sediminis]|uniref:bifunctional proline dehydrogenase/L-glutamate gamma-semialdehyde dehydrogenase n=1 Tax=Lentisalinibacter sediminis TaxID=2992237 RepID=UPI00386778C5
MVGKSAQPLTGDLSTLLADLPFDENAEAPSLAQQAVALARLLQRRATALQTPAERKQQHELARMMASPHDKATLMQMTDQSMRSDRARRAVDQLTHILDVQGVPRFFTPFDRAMLRGFQSFGGWLPGVAVPLVQDKMRQETANVILPAEEDVLPKHLQARQKTGLRMNVNFLGEALLGEEAASARLAGYLAALARPEIECISVKASTIYSQVSSLAFENTVEVLSERLEKLYREASARRFTRSDGTEVPKFVYLDMEEYRDMSVTSEAFMRALERPGLEQTGAGIALQAYIPDSYLVQKRINTWARRRVAAGGAPVTIRLVKGANLEMERVEASIRGWPQAPYKTKAEVDANFKRMLHEGMVPESLVAVHLGVASHNLFDVAYALILAAREGALSRVQFEMLEGMANHQRRALNELTENLLLYAPATKREDFIHAIGYLVRRLDENTGPDNFLAHSFRIEVGSEEWHELEQQFLASFLLIDTLSDGPRRTQDRRVEERGPVTPAPELVTFSNEPDTDFSLPQNVEWAKTLIAEWSQVRGDAAMDLPLVIAGEERRGNRAAKECRDPSRPGEVVARYPDATEADLEDALACAEADPAGWRSRSPEQRCAILGEVAGNLRLARSRLIGAAMADGGKTIPESDPEVSEAIDFVEFYRRSALYFHRLPGVEAKPKGVVAVVPPWNFPIAIPCGGVASALAAGNCVILKPASATVLVAWELAQAFWAAGVPKEALQFMPCRGSGVGAQLVADARVDAVILTGGTETALTMLDARPDMNLMAETGGKDATIVTAMADRDQAVANILHSAFSHSGQKCSATSLLVLEEEVYADEEFRRMLSDAVESLPVGPAWDRRTRVGPLVTPPGEDLHRALTTLEPGEEWAVEPRVDADNPQLWSPGVKYGVTPGSYTHMTEFFGPVLAVMMARDLDEAIEFVNQTGYGLTSGIESLDDREQAEWKDAIAAGNLYVNRVTTGAVVLRQPFGGFGKSAFGPGIKAGGPNYVAQLMDFRDRDLEETAVTEGPVAEFQQALADVRGGSSFPDHEIDRLIRACASYQRNYREEFAREHDHFRLLGQDNIRRYLPVPVVRIRVHPDDSVFEVYARAVAAHVVGARAVVSVPSGTESTVVERLETLTESWAGGIEFVRESDEDLVRMMRADTVGRLRYARPERVPETLLRASAETGVYIVRTPVLAEGRIELIGYLREQSISDDYHRYGNLGEHGAENRAEPL